MKRYDLMIINREDDKVVETNDWIVKLIEEQGKVTNVDVWGKKLLAYEIEGKTEGVYVLISFKTEEADGLKEKLNEHPNILRHLLIEVGK